MNIFERESLEYRLMWLRDMSVFFYGGTPRSHWKRIAELQARLGLPWWEAHSRAMGWMK